MHLSYGDWPARQYLKHITYFRGGRAHDIARFIGAGTTMPPDLVQGLWDVLAPQAEEWRALECSAPPSKCPTTRRCRTGCWR